MIEFTTSKGNFTIELFNDEAPISSKNFTDYVDAGFFDGTIFHRVIPGFVLQGGGFTSDMKQKKTSAPIKNEAANGLKNKRGTLSMARTSDIDSATSQFFINLVDNDFLDHKPGNFGYAKMLFPLIASEVTGMEVIDAIAKVKTGDHGHHSDVPVEPVVVETAKRS